jgi:ATP-binding cassette, subfamily C, bacterial exporter for protease/lipase
MYSKILSANPALHDALRVVRPAFIQVAGFSMVLNLLYLVPSIYMLQVYDRVLTSRNVTTLLMLTVLTGVAYLLYGVIDRVRTQLLIRIGVQIDRYLADRVFQAAFEASVKRAGPPPAQALQDLTSVRQFLAGSGALAFFDAPWLPIYILVIALVHPLLALFAIAVVVILFFVTLLTEWRTHAPISAANKESAASLAYLHNNLRYLDAIKSLGMLTGLKARWRNQHNKVISLQTAASEESAVLGSTGKTLRMLFQSLILGLGAWLAVQDQISPGGMIAANILLGRALAPAELLIGAWKQWITARESSTRLGALLSAPIAEHSAIILPHPKGHFVLKDVVAMAPGATTPALVGLNFSILPGDTVMITGPSGGGKSTLARLLVGAWPAARGSVRLDGAEVYAWDKAHLGPLIGYLPQEVALLQGTVADNIARFQSVDSNAVVKASKAAGVHDLILSLPQGYETLLGPDGGNLSGGQRQRIALARALYQDPQILVLDEPNANLDQAGEAALVNAIASAKGRGATVILVAHGQSLLQVTDKMLVLRDGGLLVYGPRDKVIAHMQELTQKAHAAQSASRATVVA